MSHAQFDPTPQAPPPWTQPAPAQGPGIARLLPVLGVVLGLLGLGMGVAAWFRAIPPITAEAPAFSDQQVADAKVGVCTAYAKGWRSLQVAGSQKKPDGPPDTLPAVTVNGRVAEVAVGNYLINSVEANPAAPSELKELVRQLGEVYQEIVLTQLADGSRSDVVPIAENADRVRAEIERLCQ
jgi:hypothetical protein